MIARDEEPVIGRALASAAGMDGVELVVVDTGSVDRTVAIAEAHGARVVRFAWTGDFSAARNFAFAQATGQWMLPLDADEELTPDFRAAFARVLSTAKGDLLTITAIEMLAGGEPGPLVHTTRLVRNDRGYAYEGRVHETIDTNVVRSGGTIVLATELTILHHGYTAAEDRRKNRRARNLGLLELAHAAEPAEPRHWHFYGLELMAVGRHDEAVRFFERMLAEAPDHPLAADSAHYLATIYLEDREPGLAWGCATFGTKGNRGRSRCLLALGTLAFDEGDAETTAWCAEELRKAPADGIVAHDQGLAWSTQLALAARSLRKPVDAKLRDALASAVKQHPQNLVLARLLVDACVRHAGARGPFEAMKRSGNEPSVLAAAMGHFLAAGRIEECIALGERGVRTVAFAFALGRAGRVDEAVAVLGALDGVEREAVVFGLAHDREDAIALGLAARTHERSALALRGAPTSDEAAALRAWLGRALVLGEDAVALRLGRALGMTDADVTAARAGARYETDPMAALNLALEAPDEACEVIGLVAHAHGDLEAAIAMLVRRARAGDAPVHVYLHGAEALAKRGRHADAKSLVTAGLEARPGSLALLAAAKAYAKRAA